MFPSELPPQIPVEFSSVGDLPHPNYTLPDDFHVTVGYLTNALQKFSMRSSPFSILAILVA